jgi:hypothetical protein
LQQSDKVSLYDIPTFLDEKAIETVWTWSMIVRKAFNDQTDLIITEV